MATPLSFASHPRRAGSRPAEIPPHRERATRDQRELGSGGRVRVSRTLANGAIVENSGKTPGSLRQVLLSDIALVALEQLPTPLHGHQLVFPTAAGRPIDLANWRRREWRDALEVAGIPYRSPYGMRDTFATLSLTDGARLEWISKQMGHGSTETTQKHYARWQESAELHELDVLNQRRAEKRIGHKPDPLQGRSLQQ